MDELEELYEKRESLENEIEYENRKLEVCGYGSSDLQYIEGLEYELEELNQKIEELEGA